MCGLIFRCLLLFCLLTGPAGFVHTADANAADMPELPLWHTIQLSTESDLETASASYRRFLETHPKYSDALRVELISSLYALRTGVYEDRQQARSVLEEIHQFNPGAYIVEANVIWERIVLPQDSAEIHAATMLAELVQDGPETPTADQHSASSTATAEERNPAPEEAATEVAPLKADAAAGANELPLNHQGQTEARAIDAAEPQAEPADTANTAPGKNTLAEASPQAQADRREKIDNALQNEEADVSQADSSQAESSQDIVFKTSRVTADGAEPMGQQKTAAPEQSGALAADSQMRGKITAEEKRDQTDAVPPVATSAAVDAEKAGQTEDSATEQQAPPQRESAPSPAQAPRADAAAQLKTEKAFSAKPIDLPDTPRFPSVEWFKTGILKKILLLLLALGSLAVILREFWQKQPEEQKEVADYHQPQCAGAPCLLPEFEERLQANMRQTILAEESLLAVHRDTRTIFVISAFRNEGKTVTSISLAHALAQNSGNDTLLIDGSSTHPDLHGLFGTDKGPGLMNVLAGQIPPEQAIRETVYKRLSLMPFGTSEAGETRLDNPQELKTLLDRLRTMYRYVIIDGPALWGSPNTALMSSAFDGVVLSVEAERTKWEVVQESREKIQRVDGKMLGIVLTKRNFYIPRFLYGKI